MVHVPAYAQLKTRNHKDSLIPPNGNRLQSKSGPIGSSLFGVSFTGRRSICLPNTTSLLIHDANTVHGNGNVSERVSPAPFMNESHFVMQTKTSKKKRKTKSKGNFNLKTSTSAPSLTTTATSTRSFGSKRLTSIEQDVINKRHTNGRQMSESFAEGLALFRKHKYIRLMADRRLSERMEGYDIRRFSELFKAGGGVGAVSKWRHKTKVRPKVPPLQRFKNYARLALICVRLCKYSHENVEASKQEYLSIIQVTADFMPIEDPDGIFFDARIYRANKEQRLPTDARKMLQKDARYRTEKEVDYLHIVLRSIKAFAEYPNKMQRQLCKVGWYEAYEPKRAIVRQGQPPHAFYFILSGSVVVTSFDRSSGGTTFLVALHKGMSFGELAVINRSRRQATVSTGTTTELLCISAKDFVEIFMAGGIKSVTDPDQNSFIRSIPFLKHWPIECLSTNPQACMFHFFSRGQVIVRDSNHSDWIYIVKSGSLSVLKKLVEANPRSSKQEEDSESEDEENKAFSNKRFGTWDFRLKKKKRRRSTIEKEVFKNNIEMEKRLEQTLPGFYNARERLALIDYDEIITDHRSRVLQSNRRMSIMGQQPLLPKLPSDMPSTAASNTTTDDNQDIDTVEDNRLTNLPKIRKTSKHVLWEEPEIKPPINLNIIPVPQLQPKGAYLASSKSSKRKVSRKEAIQEELYQKQIEYDRKLLDDKKIGRKTITDELDNKLIKDLTLTEKDIRPMFVQVQVLERGQYFGLAKTAFPEQAESFSIVSNGAECIMISKKFFLEKSTEATMHHLRQVETLLPPEEELQTNLQDFVDWKCHRAKVYNRLVRNKVSRTVRHSQYPPQYGGQYCFRTGPTVRN